MPYRLDSLSITDPAAGRLELRGDGFGAAGELLSLLESADVQRFMMLTPHETARAAEIAERYRDALKAVYANGDWQPPEIDPAASQSRAQLADEVRSLLGAERAELLRRLSWRIRGGEALVDDSLATALGISPEQRERVVAIARENEREQKRILEDLRSVRLRGPAALQERGRAAMRAAQQRLIVVLTPEQSRRFQQLIKEPSR